MRAQATVVLLTGSYPYALAGESSFLSPELPYLAKEFARVLVVPAHQGGERADLPDGIQTDESLATNLATRRGALRTLWDAVVCPPVIEEVRPRFAAFRSAITLRRLVAFAATATRVARWYEPFAARHRLDAQSTVLYTYWLDAIAAGLAIARNREPSLVVVSRGHRVDVYEEEQRPPYLPCRKWLIKRLDRIFLVSEDARRSLLSRHPEAADRLVVSRLGTPDPGFLTSASSDGVLRVVSCSTLAPVKRVDILARGLTLASRSRLDRPIVWHHFGDGPQLHEIETLLVGAATPNLTWKFFGQVDRGEVFERYRSQPVDLFANTSQSEGIPVSIMEAMSCGIPVMAPAVGGVPEAVSRDNGFLLPAPARPAAVADVVGSVLATPDVLRPRRESSRKDWEARFHSGSNFEAFARDLFVVRCLQPATTA